MSSKSKVDQARQRRGSSDDIRPPITRRLSLTMRKGLSTKIICSLAITLCCLSACAAKSPNYWKVRDLKENEFEQIRLLRQDGSHSEVVGKRRVLFLDEVASAVMEAAGDIRPTLYISDEARANAYAGYMSGEPVIIVNTDMFRLLGLDRDAFAALFGHELAHLYLSHQAARTNREAVRQLTALIGGVTLAAIGVPMGGTISEITSQAVETIYTRDEERAADQFGLYAAARAGFDPYGAVRLQELLQASSQHFAVPFLSTHPSGTERVATLRTLASRVNQAEITSAPPVGDATGNRSNSISQSKTLIFRLGIVVDAGRHHQGLLVVGVRDERAARVMAGDIIVGAAGRNGWPLVAVRSTEDVENYIRHRSAGDVILLKLLRGKEELYRQVQILE